MSNASFLFFTSGSSCNDKLLKFLQSKHYVNYHSYGRLTGTGHNHNKCFFTFVVTSSLISSTTAGIHDMRQRSRRVG